MAPNACIMENEKKFMYKMTSKDQQKNSTLYVSSFLKRFGTDSRFVCAIPQQVIS